MEITDHLRIQDTWASSEYRGWIYTSMGVIVVGPSPDALGSHAKDVCHISHLPPFIDEL
jgi:hypothetical protein